LPEIRFPKFGMSTVEVEVSSVFVTVGSSVEIGTPLVEVETDKVVTTVESDAAGIVSEIRVEPGGIYVVGDVVCVVSEASASADSAKV
jgi:pyruvate dehydrogenase E2 component (dihydrolipoamide acetyltransferase)